MSGGSDPKTIDFHAHVFPEDLAQVALARLAAMGNISPASDGTVAGLLASMDRAGIDGAVVCAVATKPEQFDSILRWLASVGGERVIPFPSVHPDADDPVGQVRRIAARGFSGFKMHPHYQSFVIDEDRMMPIYEAGAREGLIVVVHAGHDFAFPDEDRAAPWRIARVAERFPGMKLVACHLGGWRLWEDVARDLAGADVWFETSFSLSMCHGELLEKIFRLHGAERILFGTDSPWTDQTESLARLNELDFLSEAERRGVLGANALDLLAG